MNDRICIAIFAKTLGLSPVKTRLAASTGIDIAEQFYQHSLHCVAACVEQLKQHYPNLEVIWAVAEQEAVTSPHWHDKNTVWTGEGDLGARLHTIYQLALDKADHVILIGSDCPQLPHQILLQCIHQLAHKKYVLGPAEDGGFYLFASNQHIDELIWSSVEYSQPSTAEQLIHNIGEPITTLAALFDIDELCELKRLQQGFSIESRAQQNLMNWLESLP